MKIAIFSDNFYPELSGISESIVTTSKELGLRGHSVNFFAPSYPKRSFDTIGAPFEEIDLGPNVRVTRFASFPYKTGTSNGRAVIPFGLRTFRVKVFDPDIIHVHLPMGTGIEGLIAAKVLKKPFVGTNHTPMGEFKRYAPFQSQFITDRMIDLTTWFYNRCDFVSSPCNAVFGEMKRFDRSIPHRVVSNPLYPEVFTPPGDKQAFKDRFGLPGFTILYTGRLASEKNIDKTIRALAILKEELPDITLAVVGKGPVEAELKSLAQELKVEDNVKFFGFVDKKILPDLYKACDLFVIMSPAESQSISAMQALLTGIPVIAANAWGLKEYIKADWGFLLEPDDVEGLAARIKHLYLHPEMRSKMGQAGRDFTGSFSVSRIASEWEQIYTETKNRYHTRK